MITIQLAYIMLFICFIVICVYSLYVPITFREWLEERWWKKRVGMIIIVPWPTGEIDDRFSSDPNEHYRPWLETNVGLQGRDWNWKLHVSRPMDEIHIGFEKGKEDLAVQASLMWG